VSVLERVLDVLAGLLRVGLDLVRLAFGGELVVVGRVADRFLRLAGDVLSGVLDLVVESQEELLSSG